MYAHKPRDGRRPKTVVTCVYNCRRRRVAQVHTGEQPGVNHDKELIENQRARKIHHDKIEQLYIEHGWLSKRGKETQWIASREQMRMLRCWFNSLDADGSGDVGLDELCEPLVSTGLCASIAEVQALVDTVDSSGDGEIDFDEFLAMIHGEGSSSADDGHHRGPGASHVARKNPVIALFEELSSGKLGNESLSLTMLITNFRRKKLMDGNMSEDPAIRAEGSRILQAVKQLKIELLAQER